MTSPRVSPLSSFEVEVEALSIPGASGALDARLYRHGGRTRPAADALLVFFHGGGFVSGELDSIDACLRECARHVDGAIVAATYALADRQPFPAAAEDAYAVVRHCATQSKRFGWNGRALWVGGVEAGGNLAAVATLMARDRGTPAIAGQFLLMPMLDPGLSSDSMRCVCPIDANDNVAGRCATGYRRYLPRPADRVHPYASPLLASRLKGLPPTLIVSVAGDVLAGESDAYVAKLRNAGVDVELLCLDAEHDRRLLADAATRCGAANDDRVRRALAARLASIAIGPTA